jgi:uroporphyrinogen-III synthase
MKIKSILVSQPAPQGDSSPYLEMAKSEKIKIDFRPFIHVEGVDAKELRTQKIDLSHYTGVIFTSKNAIDHYFRLAEEMRFSVPDNMRYICQSEAIANYLQKHIIYRKRKISFGEKSMADLLPLFKKHLKSFIQDKDQAEEMITQYTCYYNAIKRWESNHKETEILHQLEISNLLEQLKNN